MQLLTILTQFITRSVFIRILGPQYLGINGLFSNIITMLSLAELGVGSAIIFNLYKPIQENNQKYIKLLMKFYKNTYRIIGLFILLAGIVLIPFLPYIIKDYDSLGQLGINSTLIFLLYLLQSVSTYLFFAYKAAIIRGHQKEYIITVIAAGITIITNIIQIIVLLLFKDFVIYTAVVILFIIIQNIITAVISTKMYPYISQKTNESLPEKDVKGIFKNCSALFLYKINSVVLTATDNIILSGYIGLSIVGMYSNYLLIYNSIRTILGKIYSALTASMGNLHASDNREQELRIFKLINYFTFIIFGIAAVGVFVTINKFIALWVGKTYVISTLFAFLIAIELYIDGLQKFLSMIRHSAGLFQQAKYRPLFGIIINLIISLILVNYIGIYGVIIGTIIANLSTFMWYDPIIIFRNIFKTSAKKYFFHNIIYIFLVILAGYISYYICLLINISGWGGFIIDFLICITVSLIVFILFTYRTYEFKYFRNMIKKILNESLKRTSL